MPFSFMQEAASVAATFPDLKTTVCDDYMEICRTNYDYTSQDGILVKSPLRLIVGNNGEISVEVFQHKLLTLQTPDQQETVELVKSISFYGIRHRVCPGVEFTKAPRTACQKYTVPYVHYRSRKCVFWTNVCEGLHGRHSKTRFGKCRPCQIVCTGEKEINRRAVKASAKAPVSSEENEREEEASDERFQERSTSPDIKSKQDSETINEVLVQPKTRKAKRIKELQEKDEDPAMHDHADEEGFMAKDGHKDNRNHTGIEGHNVHNDVLETVEGVETLPDIPEEKNVFPCTHCEKTYSTRAKLGNHIRSTHGKKNYPCNFCQKAFYAPTQLVKHIRSHTGEKPFECGQCKEKFTCGESLRTHMIRAHSDEKPLVCEVCGRGFVTSYHLKRHLLLHSRASETNTDPTLQPPHICNVCNEPFDTKFDLNSHRSTHVSSGIFPCATCGLQFNTNRRLRDHVKAHTKAYQCTVCEKAFASPSLLQKHTRSAHIGYRVFECEHCTETFVAQSVLDWHNMRAHLKEKPYICHVCGSSFSSNTSLNIHLEAHSEYRPFACEDCGRRYANSTYLGQHMRKKHSCNGDQFTLPSENGRSVNSSSRDRHPNSSDSNSDSAASTEGLSMTEKVFSDVFSVPHVLECVIKEELEDPLQ